jgi:hypothetical protein
MQKQKQVWQSHYLAGDYEKEPLEQVVTDRTCGTLLPLLCVRCMFAVTHTRACLRPDAGLQ